MKKLTIAAKPPYDVLLGEGLLERSGALAARAVAGRRVLIVTEDRVAEPYLERTLRAFAAAGFQTAVFRFPGGEKNKTLATVEAALNAADAAGLTRRDLFAALGGGVVGDLTGLAAALYLRGVDYIQLPTTLLAMADACVGGKTGVNLPGGKNLCGAFHQPRLALCDTDTLKTLPLRIRAEGMAEVIKCGAVCAPELLDSVRCGAEEEELIAACIRVKGRFVALDERDQGQRQLLNLGHTFGHALEKLSGFSIWHGEGVSVGLAMAAWTAERRGLCEPGVYAELRGLLAAQGLPVTTAFSAGEIAAAAMNDKKRQGDALTLALPCRRGESRLYPLPAAELAGFIACCDGEVTAR